MAQVCEPGVIPPHYLGIRTASCDSMGPVLNFPSTWLLQELSDSPSVGRSALVAQKEFPATNVVESFRLAIRPHIADPDLNAEMAAAICGTRKRTLARRLQRHGTSISAEIQGLKQSRSEQELADAGKSIKAIAQRVGYTDPVVFSRAFKRWTGLTPSQFRADN